MKKITTGLVALVAFVSAGTANAQTTAEVQLPAGYTICRTKALEPGAAPVNNIPECNSVSPAVLGRLERMQKTINEQRYRLAQTAKAAETAQQTADGANQRVGEVETRLATVEENDKAQDSDIAANTARIEALEKHDIVQDGRLDGVEARLGTVENMFPRLQLKTGFTGLVGMNGDSYAGFPVVAELRLPVAHKLALDFEGGASVAFGESPLGVVARLGLTYQLSQRLQIGPGIVGYGVGLDSQFDSSVMFSGLDARLEYNPKGMLVVGADVMPFGVNVSAHHDAKYAFGGTAYVGILF
jgi:hypothetical protein